MNRGLAEFNPEDSVFKSAFAHRIVLGGVFTGAWYLFATKFHFFNSSQGLRYSLPLAAILSFYFSKGFVYHYIAAKEVTRTLRIKRNKELIEYKNELKNKNVHA